MSLEILTSDDLLPLRHGFFTRRGGASSGVFSGLNCGMGSSDLSEVVQINRTRVAAAMEVAPDALIGVHQVHSGDAVVVQTPSQNGQTADAVVTDKPGLALTILTADCQPVLFADAKAGVIGAAHAGWRGALDGVLDATLDAMESLGAQRADTVAVIGPCISQSAYEVGQEFFDAFTAQDPNYQQFFVNGAQPGKMQFDLPSFGVHCLRQAGVKQASWIRHCTYNDPDRFYSYRRATHAQEADYGRLISAIRL